MSEAPETIWTCNHVGEYGRYFPEAVEAEGEYGGTAVSYRRADLPPTLSAALELPEVKALLEALRDMRRQFSPYPSQDTERWREEHEACEHADAALAAIKEPKT